MAGTSPAPRVAPEILRFYGTDFDEATRLTGTADGRLELVRTRELPRRQLPGTPADVLDVGGGPGAHAAWLVGDGYRVHVVDPVPRHVEAASDTGATAERGDARALPVADASYDVALVLGPLYHLLERDDRDRALAEARRVTRPGGLVAAAAIGRYASAFEHTATTLLAKDRVHDAVRDIRATGRHDPGRKGFTAAYFHTAAKLEGELRDAGLGDVTVYGVEGPGWGQVKAVEQHGGGPMAADHPVFEAALRAARLAEGHPELLAAASHLLAVARR